MYYEINVSRREDHKSGYSRDVRYVHYFATSKRSLTSMAEAQAAYTDFMTRFPAPDFMLSIHYFPEVGHTIGVDENGLLKFD